MVENDSVSSGADLQSHQSGVSYKFCMHDNMHVYDEMDSFQLACMYACVHVYVSVHVCMCACICICACMHVCMYT